METGHGECNDKELDTWTVVLTIGEFKRRDIHLEINRYSKMIINSNVIAISHDYLLNFMIPNS